MRNRPAATPATPRQSIRRPVQEGWTIGVHGTRRPYSPERRLRNEALLLASVYDAAAAHPELYGAAPPAPSLWECEQIVRRLGRGEHEEDPATPVAARA